MNQVVEDPERVRKLHELHINLGGFTETHTHFECNSENK